MVHWEKVKTWHNSDISSWNRMMALVVWYHICIDFPSQIYNTWCQFKFRSIRKSYIHWQIHENIKRVRLSDSPFHKHEHNVHYTTSCSLHLLVQCIWTSLAFRPITRGLLHFLLLSANKLQCSLNRNRLYRDSYRKQHPPFKGNYIQIYNKPGHNTWRKIFSAALSWSTKS